MVNPRYALDVSSIRNKADILLLAKTQDCRTEKWQITARVE
ncbi:hypothetical protein ACN4EK_20215 [Pantanalinema rosaneae CENA516]